MEARNCNCSSLRFLSLAAAGFFHLKIINEDDGQRDISRPEVALDEGPYFLSSRSRSAPSFFAIVSPSLSLSLSV